MSKRLWGRLLARQEVADLAEKIGLPLIPWQRWVLDDLLSVDDENAWRKKTALVLVARQNGKTHLARMLILSHLFLWGSKNVLPLINAKGTISTCPLSKILSIANCSGVSDLTRSDLPLANCGSTSGR